MTAAELARTVRARRTGKGKWVARCPAHPDRTPSMAIAEGKKGVLVRCMSQGCDTKSILDALGLGWGDLFAGKPTPAIRERLSLEDQYEALDRQLGLIAVLGAIDGKPAYWNAAEKRIKAEIDQLRCRLEPEKVYQEWRERMLKARVKKLGWERMWSELYE